MSNTPVKFTFNRTKAIEAILYIATRIPDPNFHSVSKLLYFADKTSLEKYGRFISGDTYCAMRHGPVPSKTYDLMKEAISTKEYGFRVEVKGPERNIVPLRQPDLDELSQSDRESLDVVIELYGRMPPWLKTEQSHDQAWHKAWSNRDKKRSNPMAVEDIAQLLEDGENLIEHLRTQHD